ncbi:MAG: Prepilin peptidase [Pseudomonadota bacterium]|jgi:prepilin peptidase CpaA
MTGQALLIAPYVALIPLLVLVAASDLHSRTIPNWVNGLIALLGIASWWTSGMAIWPDMAVQFGFAAIIFGVFVLFFAMNAMGGGDVKLLGALALWFQIVPMVRLLMVMSILGGVLTLIFMARHKILKLSSKIEVPYGVAIATAGIWAVYERNLNHFG